MLIVSFVVPGETTLHVALEVKLLVVGLVLLEWEQFDRLSIRVCRCFVILQGFVAIANAEITAECILVKLEVRLEITQTIFKVFLVEECLSSS